MQCPNCDEAVAVWALFCPHCGVRLHDEPPVTHEDDASLSDEIFSDGPVPEVVAPEPVLSSAPEAVAPEPAWSSAPPTEVVPVVAASAPSRRSRAAQRPSAPPAGPPVTTPPLTTPPPVTALPPVPTRRAAAYKGARRAQHRSGVPPWLMLLSGILVVIAVAVAAWAFVRVDDPGTLTPTRSAGAAASPTGSVVKTTGAASASPSASGSPSPSPSATSLPAGVPTGAVACGSAGNTQVYAGDRNTSCPFALAVAAAYAQAAATGAADSPITAHSPVTNRDYTLTCSGTPTRCAAQGGASVYLTR